MAKKEYDLWIEKFKRECGIKSAIILFGNTSDIMMNTYNQGTYMPVINSVISCLRSQKYKVTKWDRVDGIDNALSDKIADIGVSVLQSKNDYDMKMNEDDFANDEGTNYKATEEFFPYMLQQIRGGGEGRAYILDYSDYLFGSANSLSEKEREYLATLGKALEKSRPYGFLEASKKENIIILITQNSATIPPAFYLNNPMVSLINVPLPGRNEREQYVTTNLSALRVSPDIRNDKVRTDDFIDALDGFTLREIHQLMILSRQDEVERMSCEKLINLYKYGEKVSPWEELSKAKLEHIEERLQERVKGQDAAISKVKDVLIRAYTGFSGLQHSAKQKKPKGTLFFVGPTGVGKTELAKSLAEYVFGDENACVRFDMSEYNHGLNVQGPFSLAAEALVKDTERRLVTAFYRIDLMSALRTMEVELSILFTVEVIHRHAIGVTVVPQHGEHAARLILKDRQTLFLCEQLFLSQHFPEHCFPSVVKPDINPLRAAARSKSPRERSPYPIRSGRTAPSRRLRLQPEKPRGLRVRSRGLRKNAEQSSRKGRRLRTWPMCPPMTWKHTWF